MIEDPRPKPAEVRTAEDFLERLSPIDRQAVDKVVNLLGGIRDNYEQLGAPHGPAFWALYAIGGRVTKPDEEPDDIDLLIVAQREPNVEHLPSFVLSPHQHDMLSEVTDGEGMLHSVIDTFFRDYSVFVKDPVPKKYDLGASRKAVMRFIPRNEGSRVDVVYVNGSFLPDGISCALDFEQQVDVDEEGRSLKRVLLAEYIA